MNDDLTAYSGLFLFQDGMSIWNVETSTISIMFFRFAIIITTNIYSSCTM